MYSEIAIFARHFGELRLASLALKARHAGQADSQGRSGRLGKACRAARRDLKRGPAFAP